MSLHRHPGIYEYEAAVEIERHRGKDGLHFHRHYVEPWYLCFCIFISAYDLLPPKVNALMYGRGLGTNVRHLFEF